MHITLLHISYWSFYKIVIRIAQKRFLHSVLLSKTTILNIKFLYKEHKDNFFFSFNKNKLANKFKPYFISE